MDELKFSKSKIKIICLYLCLCLPLIGCSKDPKGPLTIDNLDGSRVGVIIGYSTDYILSGEDYDLDINRYDMLTDMQLALRFNRIDAIAMEFDEAGVICRIEPEYKIELTVEEDMEYAYMFNSDRQELLGQFNLFIEEFKKTEEYSDLLKRAKAAAIAPYEHKEVESTVTSNKVLKVAAFDGWEPISYINGSTGKWEGVDVELATHFANSIGAKLELIDMSWNQMLIEIALGSVDMILCPDSILMAKDLEMNGNITMSDPVYLKDIVLIVNKEVK